MIVLDRNLSPQLNKNMYYSSLPIMYLMEKSNIEGHFANLKINRKLTTIVFWPNFFKNTK